MAKGKSKTHPDIIRARERELEAVRLRRAGVEYHDIGEKIGLSESGAYECVRRVLARVVAEANETGAENLELDLQRLNVMLVGLWPKVLAGDPAAVAAALRILERRARMLGYDAPAKVAPTTPDGTEPWKLEGLTAEEITEVRVEVERLMVAADYRAWAELLTTIETRRRLVDTERRRLEAAQQMITTERAMLLVAALVDAVRRHVDDWGVLDAVGREVERLVGSGAEVEA